jgi:hypothetical protein
MKRITFIVGHYGSGKSEFALNLAVQKHVDLLIDLDIVNPYFRSRELGVELAEKNIRFVSSPIKGLGSDLPYIAKEAFLPFYRNLTSIFDLGGDDVGTKVARQFFELINYETTDFLFCVNVYREAFRLIVKVSRQLRLQKFWKKRRSKDRKWRLYPQERLRARNMFGKHLRS